MFNLILAFSAGSVLTPPALDFFGIRYLENNRVQLVGWASVKGELMLYPDRISLADKSKSPSCISGVKRNHTASEIKLYNGKHVKVTGRVVQYDHLPNEVGSLIPRKVLANSIISNFCFGESVIEIESIERLK